MVENASEDDETKAKQFGIEQRWVAVPLLSFSFLLANVVVVQAANKDIKRQKSSFSSSSFSTFLQL
jgi:hypothetical protein